MAWLFAAFAIDFVCATPNFLVARRVPYRSFSRLRRLGGGGAGPCSCLSLWFQGHTRPSFLVSDLYRITDASSKFRRGLRGKSLLGSPQPRLQRRLTFHWPPGKTSAFSFAALKPDGGPQSRPSDRA